MAGEIQYRGTETGVTLYATIRSKTSTQWNTAGTPNFEAVTAANWADYDIALTESSGNYFYVGTFPAITGNMVAGWYWVDIFKRAGGAPAITDVLQGTIVGYWDGTNLLPWASKTNEVANDAITAEAVKAGAIDAATFAADVAAAIAEWVWTAATVSYGGVGTYGQMMQNIIDDTGTAGVVVAAASKTGYTLTATTGLGNQTANITGTVSGNATTAEIADVPTVAEFEARTLAAASYATAANQVTIASYIDTEIGALTTAVADIPTNAELATALSGLATATNLATLDTLIDRLAPLLVGNVTGAGTGTEVYSYGGITVTVTVDSSGNVSAVVFS